MSKLTRLRTALESKPQLLADLVASLNTDRPRILGPWKTDLQVIHARFVVQRHDIFGDPAIFVTPKSRKGNAGPWEARVTDLWRRLLPEQAWKPLNDIDLETDNLFGYGFALDLVDQTLKDHSFSIAQHRFPEVILGPWKTFRETYTRPVIKLDPLMPPNFKLTVSQYDLGVGNETRWAWELTGGPEGYTRLLPKDGHHRHQDAQEDADRYLIGQGFNLARPTSYTLETTAPFSR